MTTPPLSAACQLLAADADIEGVTSSTCTLASSEQGKNTKYFGHRASN